MTDFGKQVAAYTDKYKKRIRATARTAVQETADMANLSDDKGGRMRIDTGFLRASQLGKVGSMPSGPTENEGNKKYTDGSYVGEPVSVALLRWDVDGETFFLGWTANYARPREYRDGFLRGATELWTQTVDKAAKQVKASI